MLINSMGWNLSQCVCMSKDHIYTLNTLQFCHVYFNKVENIISLILHENKSQIDSK